MLLSVALLMLYYYNIRYARFTLSNFGVLIFPTACAEDDVSTLKRRRKLKKGKRAVRSKKYAGS